MKSITHSQRYLPHTIETRFYAVKLYRSGNSVQFVCRRYHISKASLMHLIDLSLLTQMLILNLSSSGSRTFIAEIRTFPYVRCMASSGRKKVTPGTPDLFTGYTDL